MSKTQSTFKTIAEAPPETTDDTSETPDVRRSEVAQVISLPDIKQVDEFVEWEEMADVIRDGVMAAINV